MTQYLGYTTILENANLDTLATTANNASANATTALANAATALSTATTAEATATSALSGITTLEASLAVQPASARYLLIASAGPYVAGVLELTGRAFVYNEYSGINGSTLTTRTAVQMIADSSLPVNAAFTVRVLNSGGGSLTVVGGTDVTMNGTVTVATMTWRDFMVLVTSSTTMSFQGVGSGIVP